MHILEMLTKDIKFKVGQSIDNYCIKEYLGEGRYGVAYLAEGLNKELVTIKQLKKAMLRIGKKKVAYETRILKELNNVDCNYFPRYIGKFKDEYDRKGYILEYIEGDTFSEILYKKNKIFNKLEIYEIALELFNIIEILESKNIVHKDIRITNVIYTKNKEIKLIDFGLARYIDNKKYKRELDYWYISDFLIHLHYSNYEDDNIMIKKKTPWYDELNLITSERKLLMSLMGINNEKYDNINDIRKDILSIIKELN